jgi:hypothetical protein
MSNSCDNAHGKAAAIAKYDDELRKVSQPLVRGMNKYTTRHYVLEGLIGGVSVGLAFGLWAGATVGRTPVRDAAGHVIEYKTDNKKALDAMLKTLVPVILAMLFAYGTKTVEERKRNKKIANIFTEDIFYRCFNKPLRAYMTKGRLPISIANAAAIIINNMPYSKLVQLRSLTRGALSANPDGSCTIRNDAINAASDIISDVLACNLELGYNVLRIMRGDEPRTYFLGNLRTQKTR